jgi:hypothetical protein
MTAQFSDITRQAAVDGTISDAEVLDLRRAGWADGQIQREEAAALFAANQAATNPSNVWSDFFVEALRNFMLECQQPRGYVDDTDAQWLIEMVKADGKVCSLTELELLVQVIEKGVNAPDSLKHYVLDVVEQAVLTGTGPTRDGGTLSDAQVTEAEVRILRRTVFGSASDRPAAVSRGEAELLFRLRDATQHQANAPEFLRLFVQGVGNYLLGHASQTAQLDRARMLELEAFVADNRASVGRFMGRMAQSAPNAFGTVFGKKSAPLPSREQQVAQAAAFTAVEEQWLDQMIAANGEVDAYDQALLEFIAEEAGEA